MNNFKDARCSEPESTVHPDHFSEAIIEYYRQHSDKLRFGQFMCNHFEIHNSELFYMDDTTKAIDLFTDKYILD